MPLIVATLIRGLIQAVVTTGILVAIQNLLLPVLNKAIAEVAQYFGCTEEEAKDIIANQYLQFAETAGVLLLTIRTKTPTLIAERLGFTSKGFVLRKLSPTLASKVSGTAITQTVATVATVAEVEQVAQVVSVSKGSSVETVKTLFKYIMGFVGATSVALLAVGNWMDFANWQGAYQHTFQKLFTALGFPPDSPMPKSKSVSATTWTKIYTIVEELNPTSIAFPWENTVKPYSRENLADAVDHFSANLASHGLPATWKTVWALLLPCIKINPKTSTGTTQQTTSAPTMPATTTPKVQIFTGVVSQGILGNGTVFQPRSNDMIDDVNELIDSASINLASFLSSLPSRVSYEIKIVSTITTKDGFTQRGSTTQVQVGTYAGGQPKYKTVTNKFAILYLYLMTDKGTRTRLTTVNVGPVNSVHFQPNTNDLNAVAGRLQSIVTTSNIHDIQQIITQAPVTVTPPAPVLAPLPNYNLSAKIPNDLGYAFYMRPDTGHGPASYLAVPNYKFYNPEYSQITEEEYRRGSGDTKDYTNSGYQIVNGIFTMVNAIAPTTTFNSQSFTPATTAPPAPRLGANALTLNEWYIANGQLLPTVEARSLIYEQYQLGASSLYIGSAEQNMRLLDKLKGK